MRPFLAHRRRSSSPPFLFLSVGGDIVRTHRDVIEGEARGRRDVPLPLSSPFFFPPLLFD